MAEPCKIGTMKSICVFLLVFYINNVVCDLNDIIDKNVEEQRTNLLVDLIAHNIKTNGWNTILCCGYFPDTFYSKLRHVSFATVVTNIENEDLEIDDVVPHHSNTIILSCGNFDEYETSIQTLATSSPYWHPLANIILYIHELNPEDIPKILYGFWYYKAINAILVSYDDDEQNLMISHYSPYFTNSSSFEKTFACWTTRKVGLLFPGFKDGFTCADSCQNVTSSSKLRANNFGSCIGYSTIVIPYTSNTMRNIKLFPDKSKNLNGFTLRAYVSSVKPFMIINELENGTYTLHSRDGAIWNILQKLMNFTIDLSPSRESLEKGFNFETSINHIFGLSHRKADLYLVPIYLFDIIVVDIDMSFPYRQSGVCFMSHRADFLTTLFGGSVMRSNNTTFTRFLAAFFGIWFTFMLFSKVDKKITFDQIGKDLMNTFRNSLLLSIHKPPTRRSFRIFLTATIWSFFVLNFITQATITSFFTAAKRGKEVDTFEDIIEKGYLIEGMASPDLILPDTEENFRIINSRLAPVSNLFECVEKLNHNSRLFCLIDCCVGHFTEKNSLNEKGEQYLHMSSAKIHSHYLTLIQSKHSPLTATFNKYLIRFVEAGLIDKWEQYRFNVMKDEVQNKPLDMRDLKGVFDVYCVCVGCTIIVFLLELAIYHSIRIIKRRNKIQGRQE